MNSAVPSSDPPKQIGHEAAAPARSLRDDSPAAVSVTNSQLPIIPDHELLGPIASGAYGEVWLARNVVGTLRAVKIIRRDRHVTAESFEREFNGLQKFEPVSRAHDGLVDILTLGMLADGAGFYYVMELADEVAKVSESVSERVSGKPGANRSLTHLPAHPLTYVPLTLRAGSQAALSLPMKLSLSASSSLRRLRTCTGRDWCIAT